ncbi:MAG: response regulator transcription factor [Actinomycetota bacterium]|nr:response regulator transcription factor [Actinomycetota bacterium]
MSQPTSEIRVLVADGLPVFASAVGHALDRHADLKVVGRAHSGREVVAEAGRVHPDVIVLDADIADCGAIDAARLVRETDRTCRVVMIAAEENGETLALAIEAGVSGYVSKEAALGELVEAARAAYKGESQIPRPMLGPLLARLVQHRKERDRVTDLTARLTQQERAVLALLADGASNRTIAAQLTISVQTARTHVQNILRKLEVHSRLEAAALVMQNAVAPELATQTSAV